MIYSATSVCLTTTLSIAGDPETVAGCYRWTCNAGGSATVTINDALGIAQLSRMCVNEGDLLPFDGYEGFITCPDVASLCADRSLALEGDLAKMDLPAVREQQANPPAVVATASLPVGPSSKDGKASALSEGEIVGAALGSAALVIAALVAATLGAAAARKRRLANNVEYSLQVAGRSNEAAISSRSPLGTLA
jgi:hypothetical protein